MRGPHTQALRPERGQTVDSLRGTQGALGAYHWGTSTAPLKPPSIQHEEPLSVGRPNQDQFDSTSLPSKIGIPVELPVGVPMEEVPARLPTIEVPLSKPGLTVYVPTCLAGDQFDFSVGTAASNRIPSSWDAALGVLAQLDEPAATASVRAIDNQPRVNPFSDMHVVGPGNAKQFLGNPSALYLGM